MSTLFDKAYRLINAAKNVAKDPDRVEYINLVTGYSEPGYSGEVIATGNWNDVSRWNPETNSYEVIDRTPSRLARALEKIGVEIEWEDEWTTCSECGKLVRTSPDCYGWTRSYSDFDGEVVCHNCVDAEEHLESLEGDFRKANTIDSIDPSSFGYVLVKDHFEHGFHYGQDASPALIAAALEKQGISRYLFNIDSVGQFDIRFSVYVHEEEAELLNKEKFDEEKTDGPSVAGAMARGLEEASRKMASLPNNGIKYASVNSDGTADVRVVSPEEFIEGIKR